MLALLSADIPVTDNGMSRGASKDSVHSIVRCKYQLSVVSSGIRVVMRSTHLGMRRVYVTIILSLAIVSRNAGTVAGNRLNIWIRVKGSGHA